MNRKAYKRPEARTIELKLTQFLAASKILKDNEQFDLDPSDEGTDIQLTRDGSFSSADWGEE